MRTAVKNRVHALLARQGIRPEHTDLFGKAGREFIASLELPEGSRRRLDSLMALIGDFDGEINGTTREIDARAKTDDRVLMLCQMRGMGRYTAMLLVGEVGDVKRSQPSACAWRRLAHRPEARRQGRVVAFPSRVARLPSGEQSARRSHRRRAIACRLRADRQAPRAQHRQGRRRPPDPHPLLLRAPRRRDPLPQTPGIDDHDDGVLAELPHTFSRWRAGAQVHSRVSSLLCLASFSTSIRTAVGLIEPPSTARHSGPPRATGWMTGASSQAGTPKANRRPTPRAP